MRRPKKYFFKFSKDPTANLQSGNQSLNFKMVFNELSDFFNSCIDSKVLKAAELQFKSSAKKSKWSQYYQSECSLHLKISSNASLDLVGTGHAETRLRSKTTALAELIERIGYFLNQSKFKKLIEPKSSFEKNRKHRTSNGACVHSDPGLALSGALCELLERDIFLVQWYTNRSIPVQPIDRSHPLFLAKKKYAKKGWILRHHVWNHDIVPIFCSMVSLARRDPQQGKWNFFIGGGASYDFSKSAKKAEAEASSLFHFYNSLGQFVSSPNRMSPETLSHPKARIVFYQNPKAVKNFMERLQAASNFSQTTTIRNQKDFIKICFKRIPHLQIHTLPLPIILYKKLYCIQASSSSLQDLDWETPPKFNLLRLKQFIDQKNLKRQKWPHPVC